MKLFHMFLFIFFLIPQIVRSQSQWQYIGPNGSRNIIAINSENDIFSACDLGLYRLTDNDTNWTKLNMEIVTSTIQCIHFNSNRDIFIGTEMTGIFRSIDNGETWEAINTDLPNLSVYCITSTEVNHIFVGTKEGVFRSTDNGNHWKSANSGLPITYIFSISTNSSGTIFLGTIMQSDGGIFRSTDDGNEWKRLTEGLPYGANYLSIAFDSNNYIYTQGQYTGIFKSTNNGDNWSENTNFPLTIVNQLFITNHDDIYAATQNGVFLSKDGAETWDNVSGNLTDAQINSIATNSEGTGFAGTNNGVYKCDNIQTDVHTTENKELYFNLLQNYPNPFNPTTNIGFRIAEFGFVSLKVYDVLGREVAILVNEEKHAGNYEVKFDGSGLSSGIYFYKLNTENYSSVKKMILMK